jgi:hypothetical protein
MNGKTAAWGLWTALGLGLAIAVASPAGAQVYTWEDDRGRIHMTDDEHQIPARYRKQVQTREMAPSPASAGGKPAPDSVSGALRAGLIDAVDAHFTEVPRDKRGVIVNVLMEWLWTIVIAGVLCSIATACMFFHACASHRPLWAIAHFFLGFTVPIYAFSKLETAGVVKLSTALAWVAGPLVWAGVHVAIVRALA